MITLQRTNHPLELTIGLAEMPEVDAPGPDEIPVLDQRAADVLAEAEAVIALARAMLVSQAREEVESLRGELSEARAMIADLEAMLEKSADGKSANQARVVTPLPERPYSQRARQVLDGQPLFIDYETTGLSRNDAVVEVCVMDASGRVLLSTLINPERHIPAEAVAIHGIGDADVMDAPTWEEIAPELERLIAGQQAVAHNAPFEAKYTPTEWNVRWVCSKKLADDALGKAAYAQIMHDRRKGGSLEARLWQCGLPAGPEHTAAGDCISTLRLVRYLAGEDRPVKLSY